jgi:hyperosmotically inducible protein
MHKIKLLAIPAFVIAIGVSSAALAQYGDSPGRSQPNQPASEKVGQYVDDATITAKVKAALFSDSQLKAMNVSVQTNQGTVQLSGTVDNTSQKSEAEKVANRVDGVKSVQDLLKVRSTQEE